MDLIACHDQWLDMVIGVKSWIVEPLTYIKLYTVALPFSLSLSLSLSFKWQFEIVIVFIVFLVFKFCIKFHARC